MIKWLKYTIMETPIKTAHDSKNLDDHLGQGFETKDDSGNSWTGQEAMVTSDPIKDSGKGAPVVLRQFEFSLNPNLPKDLKFTKQDIFDSHAKQIEMMLWSDGMIPLNEVKPPKVQISKKQNKYRIFVLCTPRLGQTVLETPNTI